MTRYKKISTMKVNSVWKGGAEKINQRKGCFVLSLETHTQNINLNSTTTTVSAWVPSIIAQRDSGRILRNQ